MVKKVKIIGSDRGGVSHFFPELKISTSLNLKREDEKSGPKTPSLLQKFRKRKRTTLTSQIITTTQKSDSLLEKFCRKKKEKHCSVHKSQFLSGLPPIESSIAENTKYTDMEKQVLQLKKENEGILLAIECGYRFRFYMEDALAATKVLHIKWNQYNNLKMASIPNCRVYFHLFRLVEAGFKVGLVRQLKTNIEIKMGVGKRTIIRELSEVYSRATFPISLIEKSKHAPLIIRSRYIMSLFEQTCGTLNLFLQSTSNTQNPDKFTDFEFIEIGIVIIDIYTDDIVQYNFQDDSRRDKLWAFLHSFQPIEVILSEKRISNYSESVINQYIKVSAPLIGSIRIIRVSDSYFDYGTSVHKIDELFKSYGSKLIDYTINVPKLSVSCYCAVGGLMNYLKQFKMEKLLCVPRYREHTTHAKMILPSETIIDLNLFPPKVIEGNEKSSSVFSVINHTKTKFGKRKLMQWLKYPLTNHENIIQRQNAVKLLAFHRPRQFRNIEYTLSDLPDLSQCLRSIHQHQASPSDVFSLFKSIQNCFPFLYESDVNFIDSTLLTVVLSRCPNVEKIAMLVCNCLDEAELKSSNKINLFKIDTPVLIEKQKFELPKEYIDLKSGLEQIRSKFTKEIRRLRLYLDEPLLEYELAGTSKEYLFVVPPEKKNLIQSDWLPVSDKNNETRYRTPQLSQLCLEKDYCTEKLRKLTALAWLDFVDLLDRQVFLQLHQVIETISTLDCLLSLAQVALKEGYCLPRFSSKKQRISIEGGRHPLLDLLCKDKCVSNNVTVSKQKPFHFLMGPNMGGKSSYVRMCAIIVILAQCGSFVPAESCVVSTFDGIWTRMTQQDSLYAGQSMLESELSKTCNIITRQATRCSLVVFDEFGRGTTANDGMALAYGVVQYLIKEVQCCCFFITHYKKLVHFVLQERREGVCATDVEVWHMGFAKNENNCPDLTFQLTHGICNDSYGLVAASLAGISDDIIEEAREKSREYQAE